MIFYSKCCISFIPVQKKFKSTLLLSVSRTFHWNLGYMCEFHKMINDLKNNTKIHVMYYVCQQVSSRLIYSIGSFRDYLPINQSVFVPILRYLSIELINKPLVFVYRYLKFRWCAVVTLCGKR